MGSRSSILEIIRDQILRTIERMPQRSVYHSIDYSFSKLFSIKLFVFLNFLLNKLVVERKARKILLGTRRSAGSHVGKVALVVANGPSSNEVDWSLVKKERELGECFLFLINHSLNEPEVLERGADFLVLSDPGSHSSSLDPRTIKLWENISALPSLRLITPISWHRDIGDSRCDSLECLHFSDLSLESISVSTSPLKARGYPSLTAYKAMAFAKHLGFSTILIAGVDNSMFRALKVDSTNSLIQSPNHFVKQYGPSVNVTDIYPNGIADYFTELSEMFLSLRRCFRGTQIYNLGLQSEVDAFPKATKDTLWSKYTTHK